MSNSGQFRFRFSKSFLLVLFISVNVLWAQPGKDGNLTVTAMNTVVNVYGVLGANVAAGATSVTVTNIADLTSGTALSTGDLIMVYQAQGAAIQTSDDNNYGSVLNYNSAGRYEYAYVSSVAGNTINIGCPLSFSYATTGKTQIVRIPQYNNLTINSGASITSAAWNGLKGGIVSVHVRSNLVNNGLIDATGKGFRGGKRDNLTRGAGAAIYTLYRSFDPQDAGEKGESIVGYQADYDGIGGRYGRGAPANGGGGGNAHNAAGGGGANGNNGLTWTGAGVMDPNPAYLAAWQLDPDFVSNGNALTNSSGGGRGGYTFAFSNQDALSLPLSNATWGGDYRDPVGGRGGHPLVSIPENRVFFGGGGGAGDGNNNASADGGDGGGMVYVIARSFTGTGTVKAEGQTGFSTVAGNNDAPGGGGGGGSIVIKSFTFVGQVLSANGGSGGSQLAITNESEGCGGGGGGGFIAVPKYAIGACGTNNSYFYISGVNGISASTSMTEFPPNGGTYGAVGQNDVPISPEFLPYSLTCIIDRDNDGIHDWGIDLDDDNDGITDIEEGFISVDGSLDEDGDLARNYADPSFVPFKDDNCDGVNDYFDTDLDGIPDFHDLDSDNDGVTDCMEAGGTDANKDGIVDGFTDANSNGLSDNIENGLIPDDFDGDGLKNQRDRDADGDGITDCVEAGGTDANGDGIIDGFSDSDLDGYSTNVDPTNDNLALTGANPTGVPPLAVPDSDGDGRFNFLDIDSENDGISDNIEAQTTAGYVVPSFTDTDKDGIYNSYDADNGGTPLVLVNTDGADNLDYLDSDSDNDNVPDNIEGHDANFDGVPVPALPLSGDSDGDGLLNGYDLLSTADVTVAGMGGTGGSSPIQDTDSDGIRDWRDTDDDNDCILTSAVGITGENTNSNSIWSDDFTQGGTPRPNYLYSSVPVTVTNGSRCNPGVVSLSATGLTGTFSWYANATGGASLLTEASVSSSTFTTPVIGTTTTYYVEFTNGTCTVPRVPVVATIVTGASSLNVQGQMRCGTGSLFLTANSFVTGTFRWYDAPSGGTLLLTQTPTRNSFFTTPSISTTTVYYVEFDNGTCISSRVPVTAIVLGAAPTVVSASRCGAGTLTLSASSTQAATINWYDAPVGGTLLQSDAGVTNSSYTTISLASTTTYYVDAVVAGCPSSRVPVTATINSFLSNPTVTSASSCGTGSVVLSASSGSSGTFNWYDAPTGGTLLQTTSGVSTNNYTTPSLSVSTTYYVEFSNGTCVSARIPVSAVVLSSSSISGVNAARCGTGTLVLGASAPVNGTFRWFDASVGGTLLLTSPTGVNGSNYTTPSLTAPTSATYHVEFITASPVCTTARAAVTATVQNNIALTPTPGVICNPGTTTLSASSGTSVTFNWFSAITGGTSLQTNSGTTSSFTTPFLNNTVDFYVEATDGVCISSPRTIVRASVVTATSPNATDNSRCGTGTVQLQANYFSSGVFRWYDAPTGGTLLSTSGNVTSHAYTTPSISATTTYYVEFSTTAPACTTARVPVVANILPNAVAPTAVDGTRCGTGSVTIAAQSTVPGIFYWYTGPTGGAVIQTDQGTSLSTYFTPSIAATTTYYVEYSNAYCVSGRMAVTATVNGAGTPQSPVGVNASRCGPGSVSLQATATVSGIFRWYTALTGGTLLNTTIASNSSTYSTPSISVTTTYYVEFDNGSCVSSSRVPVIATINPIPTAPSALGGARCGAGAVTVSASSTSNGIFRWYSSNTGGTLLQTNTGVNTSSYSTPSISADQYYYVEFDDGTCTSLRDSALAVINTIPVAPTGVSASRCGTGSATLGASSIISGDFSWYDANVGGTLLQQDFNSLASSFTTPSVSGNTTYYVDFTYGSCTSISRTPVTLTLLAAPAAPNTVGNVICGIGGVATLTANTLVSTTHRWYDLPSGGTLLQTNAATTNSSYTTPLISGTTVYYVEAFDGVCSSARTNAIVNAINCAPVVDDEVITTPEETPISGDLTDAGDSDPDGTALTANTTPVKNPSNGSIVVNANGTYTYTPNTNFNGLDTVVVSICDAGIPLPAICVNDTIFITVTPVNDPPIIDNEVVTTPEETPISGDLTDAGDSDPDGTALTANTTPVRNPSNGSIVVNANGTYTYTPNTNFNGLDTAVVNICDAGIPLPAICVNDTIFITVTPVNDPPIIDNEVVTTPEETPISGDLTDAGDSDPEGTALTANTTPVKNPSNGSIVVNANGTYTYTPNANFTGLDTAVVSICDAGIPLPAICVNDTIFITVTPVNDPPIIDNEVITTPEETPISGDLTDAGDSDPDGTALTANTTPVKNPSNGSIVVNANGTYTYTPNTNFNGLDTAVVSICDAGIPLPAICVNDTIFITVTPVNDPPIIDNEVVTTPEETPISGDLTDADDSDPEGTALTANTTPVKNPSNGSIVVNANGTYTYTPNTNFNGLDTAVVSICDAGIPLPAICVNDTIFITVTPVNDPPIIDNEVITTPEETPISGDLTDAGDSDPDGTVLTANTTPVKNPSNGSIVVNANGTYTYTPNTNFNGLDTVVVSICDAGIPLPAICVNDTIFITVTPVNDPPIIDNEVITTPEETPISGDLTDVGDSDPDGTVLTANTTPVKNPSNGSIVVNANGTYTYTPNTNFNGLDTAVVSICDAGIPLPAICVNDTIFITVTPVNDPPIIDNEVVTTPEETPISGDLTDVGDSDPEGTALTANTTPVKNPSNGSIVVNANGTYTYTPNTNFNGLDTAVVSICDAGIPLPAICVNDTIFITVTPVNDPPVIDNEVVTTPEETPISGDLTDAGDSDPDGTALTANTTPVKNPSNGSIVVNANGTYTYTPNTNFNGLDTAVVSICDAGIPLPAICVNDTIFITVTPVNDPPVIDNEIITTPEETPISGDLTDAGDSDPDGTALTANTTPVKNPSNGSIVVNANGTYTYTPNTNFTGLDTAVVSICDAGIPLPAICVNDTIFITVTPVNDPPIIDNEVVTTPEETPISGDLTDAGDSDPEGTALTANTTPVKNPSNGSIVVNANGTYTYTPNTNFNGLDTAVVSICDAGIPLPAICVNDTIFITVTPVNDPPIIDNEVVTTPEETPFSGDLTDAGDSDPDGTALTANTTPVKNPSNGSIVVNANGSYTYTPNTNFIGLDTAVVSICDAGIPLPAICVNDTIFITVTPLNDPPVVTDTTITIPEDTSVVTVCRTILDPDAGSAFTSLSLCSPTKGTVGTTTIVGNQICVQYTPSLNENGNDTICFEICDNGTPSLCDTLRIPILITPKNDPPVVTDTTITIPEDTSVVTVCRTILDPDAGSAFTSLSLCSPTKGTVGTTTIVGNQICVQYTPSLNENGNDTICFEICDNGTPSLCDTLRIPIVITPKNDPPVVTDTTITIPEDTSVVTVCRTILDPDAGSAFTSLSLCSPTKGTVGTTTIVGNQICVQYTPSLNENGNDTICFEICDNGTPTLCDTLRIPIVITPKNDPPVVTDTTITIPEDTSVVTVCRTILDPDAGSAFTSLSLCSPTKGTVGTTTIVGNQICVQYTPSLNENGNDTICFEICDNGTPTLCDTLRIPIVITPKNDPPVVTDTTITIPEDTSVVIVCRTILDPDAGSAFTSLSLCSPTKGTVGTTTIVGNQICVQYTPSLNENGNDTICFEICDNGSPTLCDTLRIPIVITPKNDPPVVTDTTITIPEDTSVVTVCRTIVDPDAGSSFTSLSLCSPTKGTVGTTTIVGNQICVQYTPSLNENGNDTICFEICDNGTPSLCDTLRIPIVITPKNDPPVVTDTTITIPEDTSVVTVCRTILDPDAGSAFTSLSLCSPTKGTVGTTTIVGNQICVQYTPSLNENGNDTICFEICDNGTPSLCDTLRIPIVITPKNDPPVVTDTTITIPEDTSVVTVCRTIVDPDAGSAFTSLSLCSPTKGTVGTTTIVGNQICVQYTPSLNENGNDTICFEICDNGSPTLCDTLRIPIVITPKNDPPVVTDTTITIPEDTSVVTVCRTILDPDAGSAFTSLSLCSPTKGTVGTTTIVGNQICVQYTPSLNENGNDTICFEICDNGTPSLCDTLRIPIVITLKNDPPLVDHEHLTTPENVPISGDLTDVGDLDPDTTVLVATTTPLSGPTNGTIIINSNGTFTYTPNTNFNGFDTVVVEICDSGNPLPSLCVPDTIYIRINSVNTTPVVVNDFATTTEDTPVSGTVITSSDVDPDGTPMTATTTPIKSPAHGVITILTDGSYTYTPSTNYHGADTVIVELCDGGIPLPSICLPDTLFITITPVNDPPIAINEYLTTPKDNTVSGTVFNMDYDPDGDSILVTTTLIQTPANGSYTLSQTGAFTYTPKFGYVGNDTLIVELCDDGTPVLCTRDTIVIVVSPGASYIPEGFSPNGDGINDNFVILSNPGDEVSIWVYNRWGNLVFEDKEYQNDWNGTANKGIASSDSGLPDGTYFCIIEINQGEFKEVRYITIHR